MVSPRVRLEDLVVDRDEADLGRLVGGRGDQLIVRVDQVLVEDHAERVRHLLARALDVGGHRGGLGDHLVLEARVELHVAGLVDLLRGQEGGLLLAPVGGDQAGELRGDPLLGHHQRSEHEQHERPVGLRQARPLLAVAVEVDRERAPLGVLPVAVERLRVVEADLAHEQQSEAVSRVAHAQPVSPQSHAVASARLDPPASSLSSCVAKTSHGVPSGSCTQILSWRA